MSEQTGVDAERELGLNPGELAVCVGVLVVLIPETRCPANLALSHICPNPVMRSPITPSTQPPCLLSSIHPTDGRNVSRTIPFGFSG